MSEETKAEDLGDKNRYNENVVEKKIECRIYVLFDPETPDDVRYVGKTTCSPAVRLQGHIDDKRMCHKRAWVISVLKKGRRPGIRVIEEIESPDEVIHDERETYWIAWYKEAGYKLTNTKPGGGSVKLSEETKKKIGDANRGKKRTEETKIKIGLAGKGRIPHNKGKKLSPETIAKMSLALKGRKTWNKGIPRPPEVQERLRTQTIGYKHTDEDKKKIGEASHKYWDNPETRRKREDPEYKKRFSEAIKEGMRKASESKIEDPEKNRKRQEKHSEMMRKKWQDPEYKKRVGAKIAEYHRKQRENKEGKQ